MSLYFIYGTLKKDMRNSHITNMVKARFITKCKTVSKYPMFDLGDNFPYIQNKKGIGKILKGELYEVHTKFDKKLDDFEGVPELYHRGIIEVEYDGIIVEAHCYFISEELDKTELDQIDFLEEWVDS